LALTALRALALPGAVAGLVAGGVAACARPARQSTAPQVMTPVRIDLSSMPGGAAGATAGGGSAAGVGADLFARFVHRDELVWPGPNRYRAASGAPGPDYWQQRADYTIAATLDTANGGAPAARARR
jgi:hypothetical protein